MFGLDFPSKSTHAAAAAAPLEGGAKKAGEKVMVLGRERRCVKEGRKSMISYKGTMMCLTDARALEKTLVAKAKKAAPKKAAPKKAKKAKKAVKKTA